MITTAKAPKSSTTDPIVQVIDLVPHESGEGTGKSQSNKGQGGKGQGKDGGEKGEKKGMLGNNPPYGK